MAWWKKASRHERYAGFFSEGRRRALRRAIWSLPLWLWAVAPATGQCPESVHELGVVTAETDLDCAMVVESQQDYTEHCDPESCFCKRLTVETPLASVVVEATLKVNEPQSLPARGTIMMMAGGCGRGLWQHLEPIDSGDPPLRAIMKLNELGFRTVQLTFLNEGGWCIGVEGESPGFSAMAARPATATRWVFDNLHDGGTFGVTGNSAGSAVFGWLLTHYGLHELVDIAVLSSGPPFGDMVGGCGLAEEELRWRLTQREEVDNGYGVVNGPCANQDPGFEAAFAADGVASNHLNACYAYEDTVVRFVAGEDDQGNAPLHQLAVLDLMEAAGSDVGLTLLSDVAHKVPGYRTGARVIVSLFEQHSPAGLASQP